MFIIFTIKTMALFSYFYSARPSGVFGPSCLKQQQDGKALQWASEEMKGDRELCTAAVAHDGQALEWASEEMKGDRELCMAAVAQDWHAHKYPSRRCSRKKI